MTSVSIALKEWAVICAALGKGKQALLLRKGGIAEPGKSFEPTHSRFWLYPTWLHQKSEALSPDLDQNLGEILVRKPTWGTVTLETIAEVVAAYEVASEEQAVELAKWQLLNEQTIRQRYHYRRPGLTALVLKVSKTQSPLFLEETPAFAGCKSWVDLGQEYAANDCQQILPDSELNKIVYAVDTILKSGKSI